MKSTIFSLLALSTGVFSVGAISVDVNIKAGSDVVSQISDGQVQSPATAAPEIPALVTSTIKQTSVHTISECASTVTDCPYTTAPVTTTYVNEYTTICPVTATETSAPVTSSAPAEVVSTVISTQEFTISSCAPEVTNCPYRSSSSAPIATTVPASSASQSVGVPASSSPVSLPGGLVSSPIVTPVESTVPVVPVKSTTPVIPPIETTAAPAPTSSPVLSVVTISTCVPTVITSVITVSPSAPSSASKAPVASTGVVPVGPKNSTIPYASANGASSQMASGLLIAAGMAIALF
ncbi:hypothetical protein B7494_g2175 [Chlorociboria aeruginascens]|nr:hypothetical protein B7494_g2175 [Chlorociboria aeruginascens]